MECAVGIGCNGSDVLLRYSDVHGFIGGSAVIAVETVVHVCSSSDLLLVSVGSSVVLEGSVEVKGLASVWGPVYWTSGDCYACRYNGGIGGPYSPTVAAFEECPVSASSGLVGVLSDLSVSYSSDLVCLVLVCEPCRTLRTPTVSGASAVLSVTAVAVRVGSLVKFGRLVVDWTVSASAVA